MEVSSLTRVSYLLSLTLLSTGLFFELFQRSEGIVLSHFEERIQFV